VNTTVVDVWLNDERVGQVTVVHSPDVDREQIAASAHQALSNDATFVVHGRNITVDAIKEWQA
jgi:hypothetical protein